MALLIKCGDSQLDDITHKVEVSEQAKRYREANKEACQERSKNYRATHKEHKKNYEREKLKSDPVYKLSHTLRVRINDALRGCHKVGSAVRDLGCTVDELRAYLEAKFRPHPQTGEPMTWENHTTNGWHVDHIVPLASFDLADPEQFKKACHYTNLQPLWWHENLQKSTKAEAA